MNAPQPSGRVLGVIPARLGSERLARKPLHPVAGRPLIEWVWRRVSSFDTLDHVVVATDSPEIATVCSRMGAAVEMTAAELRSGTERVAQVATRSSYRDFEVVVNIQGDEPFVAEEAVARSAALVQAGWDVGTPAVPIGTAAELRDPGVVKVVRGADAGALYFSRAAIPWKREGEPTGAEFAAGQWLRHVGVYAYSPDALRRWVSLPESRLERTERLEQLRALEAGLRFGIALLERRADEESMGGIDTPEDAMRAEKMLAGTVPPGTTNDG